MSTPNPAAFPRLTTPEQLARETPALDPKYLRNWFGNLPVANSAATAQEVYRVLCGLNRVPMDARDRLELLELCESPVASVTTGLLPHLAPVVLPLPPKKRQLADFLRQLQTEMAYGYKTLLRDLHAGPAAWVKHPDIMTIGIERAIRYLGLSLLHSYQAYLPYPAGVWREIHGLYRYAEENHGHTALVACTAASDAAKTTITTSYLQTALLGVCSPYQLPPNECVQIHAFLGLWADKAHITPALDVTDTAGHFLIDLSADLPPIVFPHDIKPKAAPHLRHLVSLELARGAHALIGRLQKGEAPRTLNIGSDCIDTACIDMLQRLLKFWGLSAGRQFSRRPKKDSLLSVCTGLKAVHFFSDGQRPFAPPESSEAPADADVEIDLQGPPRHALDMDNAARTVPEENFRIERWRIRDESAAGLSLLHLGEESVAVRVGDLLGILNEDSGIWRVGVVRWLKNPEMAMLEMGVEMLAPAAHPAAVKPLVGEDRSTSAYSQALLLPAVEALRQPLSLIIARGSYQPGQELWLADGQGRPRRVRPLHVIERSAAFEQLAFAELGAG
ncbi:MAG: hypothetical protein HY942_00530 [Gammaproteobacteria bacterium]|nr:hypothetical protein [Gammaproteobacteria bacterium]